MNFSDVLAFAKAGWTPADVKEMMKATTEEKETSVTEEKETSVTKDVPRGTSKEPEQTTEDVKDSEQTEDEIDYKALYEAEQQKVKDLQKANTKKDIKGEQDTKTDYDIVADFARSFM